MDGSPIEVRRAAGGDAAAVAGLAGELAQSFAFSREHFATSYAALLDAGDACLLVADGGAGPVGYLLGFCHLTFYANGPVAWAEEICVRGGHRGRGAGRALMNAFEDWAGRRGCVLVALATRRAEPFYLALGYERSATYLRKVLPDRASGGDAGPCGTPAGRMPP